MKVNRDVVTREEVIRFYVKYDLGKKRNDGQVPLAGLEADLEKWPWDDPSGIDQKLKENGLKWGVLAAYRTWKLVELTLADLLECAIVDHIFLGEPQALGQLILRGNLAEWLPTGAPEWWRLIGNGSELKVESALVLRRALKSEGPVKWYIEDGSGRALALLQRILRYGEARRTAWAYIGCEPDENSAFLKSRPELKDPGLGPT